MRNMEANKFDEVAAGEMLALTSGRGRIYTYPYHWQVPAATEMAAYQAIKENKKSLDFDYLGFAWATIIDGIRSRSVKAWEILDAAARIAEDLPSEPSRPRITVAQHIHALRFPEIFSALGITDIYWSHATTDLLSHQGMRIHPFPLFPAQAPTAEMRVPASQPRKYLANFIGAYNPRIYLSNVRQVIFNDAGKNEDLLIIARNAWHFDRTVYDEQMRGVIPVAEQRAEEARNKKEYIDAIRDSWFTLCPTGSGPNSIRTFESLALGSIPIILTKKLRLPGSPLLWPSACIFEEDSESGYRRAIERARLMVQEERIEMSARGEELFKLVSPEGYGRLLGISGRE